MTLIIEKPTGAKLVMAQTYVGIDDPDAAVYIAAVEAADEAASPGVGALETATKVAIHGFVKGCKNDGIWPAIKASCILAGARTLAGALVPLAGAAPTNFNFVSGDYNRKTGLVGDGSTKYLNSNRNNNADPQNSKHHSAYLTSTGTSGSFHAYVSSYNTTTNQGTELSRSGGTPTSAFFAANGAAQTPNAGGGTTGFYGVNRVSSATITARVGLTNYTISSTSVSPPSAETSIFRRPLSTPVGYTDACLAFYSIGESLDLALLDSRVTALVNAFAAAIP
jgi:hypothetical protein